MRSSWTSSGSSSEPGVAAGHARAAQRRLHAAAELAQRERLGDVVVGAELEAEDLVDLLGLGREHDDRHRRARAHAPADLEAVEARASSRRARRGRRSSRRSAPAPRGRRWPGRPRSRPCAAGTRAASGSTARRRRGGCGAGARACRSKTGYAQLPCGFRMLDPRIYRAALIPVLFALIVGAFSLRTGRARSAPRSSPTRSPRSAPRPTSTPGQTPIPTRRAGDAGDAALARAARRRLPRDGLLPGLHAVLRRRDGRRRAPTDHGHRAPGRPARPGPRGGGPPRRRSGAARAPSSRAPRR